MKVIQVEQNTEEWLDLRRGKITGSKNVRPKRGNNKLDDYYKLISEQLETEKEDMSASDQGHSLEPEAIKHFEDLTGKKVDTNMMWISDESEQIALSPDGGIKNKGKYTEAVEAKCLAGHNHIRAIDEDKIPNKFQDQMLQYFVVNDDLQTLYFLFYDPYIQAKPLHIIEVHRKDIQQEVEEYKQFQLDILKDVNALIEKLAF